MVIRISVTEKKKHPWIQGFICRGFMQLGKQPTHIRGGHIDLFHI